MVHDILVSLSNHVAMFFFFNNNGLSMNDTN